MMRYSESPKERGIILPVALCFAFTIIVFAPVNLYFLNKASFSLFLKNVFFYSLPLAFLLVLFLVLGLSLLRSSARERAVSLLVVLSALLWFQGNILQWRYGVLDGRGVPWGRFWLYGIIDTSIWALALFFAVKKSRFFNRFARTIVAFLIVIQCASVLMAFFQTQRESENFKYYHIDASSKFEFSQGKNVILVVLDGFQSDIFQDIIAQDASYKDIFDGFTYFPDSLAGFSYTELAVPALLTGKLYDNSVSKAEFFKSSFMNDSISHFLKQKGFRSELYPLKCEVASVYFDESVADNFKRGASVSFRQNIKDMLYLYDLSLFKHLPHSAKKYIYNDGQWFLYRMPTLPAVLSLRNFFNVFRVRVYPEEDIEFTRSAMLKTRLREGKGTFKYYHLWGVHEPLTINEKLEIGYMPFSRANYIRQAKASLLTCKEFLDILKQNGAYDNSLIFMLGDHGSGSREDMYIRPVYDSRNDALNEKSLQHNFQHDKAKGIPLVLAKQFDSRGGLKVSDAPVSLTDIPKTVVSELGMAADYPGVSIFKTDYEAGRERYFCAYEWGGNIRNDYVAPITKYIVRGFSWDNGSWDVLTILHRKDREKAR